MKANRLICVFLLLMSGVVIAQAFSLVDTNLPVPQLTNSVLTSSEKFTELKIKAENGDANAQLQIGFDYFYGREVPTDYAEAVKWFRKAADQGNAGAQFNLGLCYDLGQGVSHDDTEAMKWYRKAAENGDADAQSCLGMMYSEGKRMPQDNFEAAKWFGKAAQQGIAIAQYNLGCLYRDGAGVSTNFDLAIELFRKAAGQGLAMAQRNLAQMYYEGKGVERNYTEAAKWFRKAAGQGMAAAQHDLGVMYFNGEGVETNYAEAAKWFSKAAVQGNVSAQVCLGGCYDDGQGVLRDDSEAIKWYRKAADQGDAYAQCRLGQMYGNGKGVPQDYAEAIKWERKAAEQGDSYAQCLLGIGFERGQGVPQDYIEAYKWYNLAAAGGHSKASEFRSYIADKMTPDQIAEAQRRSSAFVPRKETPVSNSGIATSSENPTATGTGFFITDEGYLISNYHVVKGAAKVRLQTSKGLIEAAVVKVDAANDLALLKAVGRFAPLPIAASRTVKLGGTVATVGFPSTGLQGFSPKLAKGEIGSLAGAADDPRYFQISVPVQPGNSGGALVDARGNVVGIVSAKLSAKAALDATGQLPENVNYAVKSSLLLSFLESVPDVAAKLKDPKSLQTATPPFEDVVKSAQDAAVLVLVY